MAVFVLGVVLLVLAPSVVALAIRRHRGGRHRAPDPLPAVVLARTSVGAVAIGSTASAVVLVSHGVPLTRPAPDAVRAAAPPAAVLSPSNGTAGPTTADVEASDAPASDAPTSDAPTPAVDVRRLAVAVPAPTRRAVVPEPRTLPAVPASRAPQITTIPVAEPASRAPQVTTIPVAEPTSGRGGSTPQARPTDDSPSTDSPSTGSPSTGSPSTVSPSTVSPSSPRPGRPDSGGGKDSADSSGAGHDDDGTDTDGGTPTAPPTGSDKPSTGSDEPSSGSDQPTSGSDGAPDDGRGRHRWAEPS